jgi:hypothetical protein
MPSSVWIEVFRVGTHKGRKYVLEDLQAIVEASRGKQIELRDGGHASGKVAGSVAELAVRDNSLFARVEGVDGATRGRLESAGYEGVSVALVGKRLDHVALLDRTKPSVKGMLPPGESFAEGHTTLAAASDAVFDVEFEAGREAVRGLRR